MLGGFVPVCAVGFDGFAVSVGGAAVAGDGEAVGDFYKLEAVGGCLVVVGGVGGVVGFLTGGGSILQTQ